MPSVEITYRVNENVKWKNLIHCRVTAAKWYTQAWGKSSAAMVLHSSNISSRLVVSGLQLICLSGDDAR